MQSVLQYRRFKRDLEEQVERYGISEVSRCATPRKVTTNLTRQRTWKDVYHEDLPGEEVKDADLPSIRQDTTILSGASTSHETSATRQKTNTSLQAHLPAEDNQISQTKDHAVQRPSDEIDVDVEKQDHTLAPSSSSSDSSSSHTEAGYETEADTDAPEALNKKGTRLGQWMSGINVQTREPKKPANDEKTEHVFIVGFRNEKDEANPHNWPRVRRIFYTFLVSQIGFVVGLASSIDSAALSQAQQDFGVSEVAESMATGIYLIGFGFGAFTAGPVSETIGRNPVYLVTGVLYMIFVMASGLAQNIGQQLVFRFFAGFFGSTPLTCAGGTLSDMWNAVERTAAFPVFAEAAFLGPIIGPVIGGFIGQSSLSWRWCEWITLIWSGLVFAIVALVMPETYAPVLLSWKSKHLRQLTGDSRFKSALEAQDTTFGDRILHNLYRPWLMFVLEPIVVLFTLYLSVVYIILFTFLTGFEFIFEETYGLSQGLTFLIFLALATGILSAAFLVPFIVRKYNRDLKAIKASTDNPNATLPPEQRLIFSMITAPFLPIGILWMAWTAYPSVSVWAPITSCVVTGWAIIGIFISTYTYLIDAFAQHAASALVGITFVRYLVAGGMIPVSIPFYENLGVHWTLTILGAIAAVMAPVPYIFHRYGATIRKKSRHAVGN